MGVEESIVEETQDTQIQREMCVEAQEGGHGHYRENSFDIDRSLFLQFRDVFKVFFQYIGLHINHYSNKQATV